MPYFISDKNSDCSGWAVEKEDGTVIGCHGSKQDAIDQMVAVSLAEDMPPGGERIDSASEAVIVDIDGTLLNGSRPIQKNIDYVNILHERFKIYIVTGRFEDLKDQTEAELRDAGVMYDDLEMREPGYPSSDAFKAYKAADILEEYSVVLAIDQNPDSRRVYQELGIETLDPKTIEAGDQPSIRQVDLTIPRYIREAAGRGIQLHEEGKSGNVVARTVREARLMASGEISEDKVIRANAWGARHLVDLDAPQNSNPDADGWPGAGAVAFYLWGIDPLNPEPAMAWFARKTEQIRAEENRSFTFWRQGATVSAVDQATVSAVDQATVSAVDQVETRRIAFNEFELRDAAEGMTFSGYAAVFNQDSEPLPFIERIAPGAFGRSLRSRNNIRMYMNHDSSMLLATTRARTLRLMEDEYGLKVEADLPDTTVGRDLATLMRRGDVDSMSFGFTVPKGGDSWSEDGTMRTLKQIRLFEVSVVTGFPAYTGTKAAVRSLDDLATRTGQDADQLAAALNVLESGENLTADQAALLRDTVAKLSPVTKPAGPSPELLRKHLALQAKFQ